MGKQTAEDELVVEGIARVAYQAYGETTDNKNFRGEQMPTFDQLPILIKTAWKNAVRAACECHDQQRDMRNMRSLEDDD